MNQPDEDRGEFSHPTIQYLTSPFVVAITVIRFVAALVIVVSPMLGLILSVLFDILDGVVIIHILCFPRSFYHAWDKVVDWVAYITEYLVAITYGLGLPFFLLLFWRFAGQYMFLRMKNTAFFILFPNFFEMAFFWLILFHPKVTQIDLSQPQPWGWLIFFFVAKLLHEFIHHFLWPRYVTPRVTEGTVRFWRRILPLHRFT